MLKYVDEIKIHLFFPDRHVLRWVQYYLEGQIIELWIMNYMTENEAAHFMGENCL